MTATCARLAASATREKSLSRASVEGFLIWAGGGGAGIETEAVLLEGDGRAEVAAAVDMDEPAAPAAWLGDWMGASIFIEDCKKMRG